MKEILCERHVRTDWLSLLERLFFLNMHFIYLKGRMTEIDIDFHLLIHSPNVCSSQEPRTPCKSLNGAAGTQVVGPLCAASQVHSQEAGSEVELRLGPRHFSTGFLGCGYPRRWRNLLCHSICLLSCLHSHMCRSLGRALCRWPALPVLWSIT